MNFIKVILFTTLGISSLLAAETKSNSPKKTHTAPTAPAEVQKNFQESQFKSHMVNHYNEGCPSNSECSATMGKLYKRWVDSLDNFSTEKEGHRLLEKFRKNNGVPFQLWTTSKAKAQEGIIFWDSPCEEHNKENQEHYGIGFVMVKHLKDLNDLKKKNLVHLRFLKLLQEENSPILEYEALRGETPVYIDGEKLVYQKLEEGNSYGLSVQTSGELHVVPTKVPPEYPRSIDCPKALVDSLDKKKMPQHLYSGVYCQRTWNMSRKKFDILMVPWSCN